MVNCINKIRQYLLPTNNTHNLISLRNKFSLKVIQHDKINNKSHGQTHKQAYDNNIIYKLAHKYTNHEQKHNKVLLLTDK